MSDDPATPGTEPRPADAPRQGRPRGFAGALGWTVANAVVPGTGLLAAGRRVLGGIVLVAFLALAGVAVWLATGGRRTAVRAAVDTGSLAWIVAGIALVAVLWCAVVVAGYLLLVPRGTGRGRHLLGAAVVLVLVAAVVAPAVFTGRLAMTQRDLIAGVFDDDGQSATVEDVPDPFGDQERVNVLLLGGDGGEGREGVRTDTVIVASIDTETGDTTLFSLPRNLEDLPFPQDSPLAQVYPDGFDAGSESESLLNAVYRNGPAQHPDILGPTDNPGADFLKLGVGEALGLELDYYVLVNLDGFSRLVDALGGISVNVNYWVPINGDPGTGELPDDYIAPGPDRRMDGYTALQFARGRFGLTDYDRMDRQRCTIGAIVEAADPATLLRKYQELARTTRDILFTDIPRSALGDFVDLGFLVKDAEIRSVVFDPDVITPAYPDYDLIRSIVRTALEPAPAAPSAPPTGAPDDGTGTDGGTDAGDEVADGAPVPGPVPPDAGAPVVTEVGDACAYDRAQAEAALAAGKPPSKFG